VDREEARRQHAASKTKFVAEQEKFNSALVEFRARFEASEPAAIVEYCSQVLERSQYPDCIALANSVSFDAEAGFVTVDLDMPPPEGVPSTTGYKFVARGNRVEPLSLKKKDAAALYQSVIDQIVLRTIHEILEGCYIPAVTGVLLNGWVTSLDTATGNDKRERVYSVVAQRSAFESLHLSRIDPAACIQKLSEGVGQIDGASL
jgi:restriction system protein